jgi:hypothetical protein
MLAVFHTRHHDSLGGGITRQFVCNHPARRYTLLLEQLPEQALGGLHVASALDEYVEYDSMLVHCAPEPMLLTRDDDHNLVEMSLVARCWKTPAIWLAKLWPNFSAHCWIVSWLTKIPRSASISSTIRRLSGKRKYNQTAWLITSARNR